MVRKTIKDKLRTIDLANPSTRGLNDHDAKADDWSVIQLVTAKTWAAQYEDFFNRCES